jgi:tryptophan-rich sensory protein
MTTTTHQPPAPRSLAVLAGAFVLCFAVAGLGSVATMAGMDGWYQTLAKPSWNPPDAVFGPVWTLLFAAQAIAAWRVWRAGGAYARGALTLFGVQLALNLGWSVVFFALQQPTAALVEIVVLLVAIVATTVAFARHDRVAAWLFVPYLAWVAFATVLNAVIASLN